METSEQIYKSRLASFKSVIKNIAINQKSHNRAYRDAQSRAAIEIHHPLLAAEKSLKYEYMSSSDRDRWHEITRKFEYATVDTPDYLCSFSAREIQFAYALCRGRTHSEIEQKVAKGNEIDMMKVNCAIILMMGAINLFAGAKMAALVSDEKLDFIRGSMNGRKYGWELHDWEKKVKGMIEL